MAFDVRLQSYGTGFNIDLADHYTASGFAEADSFGSASLSHVTPATGFSDQDAFPAGTASEPPTGLTGSGFSSVSAIRPFFIGR